MPTYDNPDVYDADSKDLAQLRQREQTPETASSPAGTNISGGAVGQGSTQNKQQPTSSSDKDASSEASGDSKGGAKSSKLSSFLKNKVGKKKGIAGIITAMVLGGGGIFGANYLAGPIEFVHLTKTLVSSHMGVHEDQSDMRTSSIVRYLHDPSKPQNVRLTIVSNAFANKFEDRLNQSGLKSTYTKNFGYGDGYVVDRDSDKFKGLSDKQVKSKLVSDFDVSTSAISGSGDTIKVNVGTGYRANAALNRSLLKSVNYSKITAWEGSRLLGKRAGVTWHPIRKLDDKVLRTADAKLTEWQKNRTTEINEGAAAVQEQIDGPKDKDGNAADTNETKAAQSAVNDTQSEAATTASSTDPGAIEKFQSHIGTKLAGGVAAVAGIACLAKSVNDAATEDKQAKVILPAMRFGVDAVSSGYQVMSGQDIDTSALAYQHGLMTGKDASGTKTSWFQADSIMAQTGQDGTGVAPDSTLTSIAKGGPFDKIFNKPGVKSAMDATCSTGGTIVLTAFSFATGPFSTIAGAVGGYLAGPTVVKYLAHWFVGKPIDALAAGADYGSTADYGFLLASNDVNLSNGGTALTSQQVASLQSTTDGMDQQEFDTKDFAYRMFNPSDTRSLVGKTIQETGSNQNVASLASRVVELPRIAGSIFGNMLTLNKAHAAPQPYNYGIPVYGYSSSDMEDPSVKNPYKNAGHAADLLEGSSGNDYIEKAKKCFGAEISKDSDGVWDVNSNTDAVAAYNPNAYSSSDCASGGKDWLSIRMFVFDTITVDGMACYDGDAQSCSDLGMTTSNATNTASQTTFTVASYNMCNDAQHADCQKPAEKVPKMTSVIEGQSSISDSPFDIIGAQEISPDTQSGLLSKLSGYQSFPTTVPGAQGRAILWNGAKFKQVQTGRLAGIYSNDTSFIKDEDSDQAFPWVDLQPVQGGPSIYVLSIHNPSIDRPNSAGMRGKNAAAILAWAKKYATGTNVVIVTGDFNRSGNSLDGANNSYCIMTGDGTMQHGYDMAQGKSPTPKCPTSDGTKIPIDQIYASTNAGVTAADWGRVKDPGTSGTDHSPAFVTYTIPGAANTGSVNYKNPIINQQSAGESVIRDGTTFHLYATGSGKIQHYTSSDAVHWKGQTSISIKNMPGSAGVQMWKPSISKVGNMYVMSWAGSAGTSGTGGFTIYYGTGQSTDGPFTYGGQLIPKAASGNNIDPQIFADDNGQYYLYFTNGRSSGLQGVQLSVSGTTIKAVGSPTKLVQFDANYGDDWTIEAPYVVKRNGQYQMYFSTGDYQASSRSSNPKWHGSRGDYMMHVAQSSSPLGQYARKQTAGKPDDIVVGNNAAWVGVGTTTVFTDDTGQDWMIYAGRYPTGTTDRVSLMDKITYDGSGWPTINGGQGASSTSLPGPALAGIGSDSTTGQSGQTSIADTYGPACTGKGGSIWGVHCTGECVDYVEYLLNKTYNSPGKFSGFGTGSNVVPKLIADYGMQRDASAQVGDVVSWPASTGHIHVAAVIKVNQDGSIIVAEYNWNNNGPISVQGRSFDTRLVDSKTAQGLLYAHANLQF